MLTRTQLTKRLKKELEEGTYPYGRSRESDYLTVCNNDYAQDIINKRIKIESILKRLESRQINLREAKEQLKEIDRRLAKPAQFKCPHCEKISNYLHYSGSQRIHGNIDIDSGDHEPDDYEDNGDDYEYYCPKCDTTLNYDEVEDYLP